MNKWLPALLICLLFTVLHAQTVDWQWAKASSGAGLQQGYSVATDPNGNVYLTGGFEGLEFTFADSFLLAPTRSSNVSYLMKCNSQGQVLWLQNICGPGVFQLSYVATDAGGNVYCVGNTSDTVTIGDSVFVGPSNIIRVYIIKYDSTGNVLWATRTDSTAYMNLGGIATDAAGNVYITGEYTGQSMNFGNISISQNNPDNESLFLAKYRPSGQVAWVETDGELSSSGVAGNAVAADNAGNVYITGTFYQRADLGPFTLGGYNGVGTQDIFLAKYDSAGTILWATSAGGNNQAIPTGITTDVQGSAYITGYFLNDTLYFGANATDTLINTTSANAELSTMLVAKYSPSGALLWAKCAEGTTFDKGNSIVADTSGNIFVDGTFQVGHVFMFDSVTIPQPVMEQSPMFILTLDTGGNLLCYASLRFGGNRSSLCADNRGNAYFTSLFSQNNFIIGNDTLLLTGSDNAFLAKFNCSSVPVGINTIEAPTATLLLYPNPFSDEATVQYALPEGSKNASLIIYDMLGRQQRTYPLNNTGGLVTINANTLSSGVYLYSLMVNGIPVVTKRMVLQW